MSKAKEVQRESAGREREGSAISASERICCSGGDASSRARVRRPFRGRGWREELLALKRELAKVKRERDFLRVPENRSEVSASASRRLPCPTEKVSGFYGWVRRPMSTRERDNRRLLRQASDSVMGCPGCTRSASRTASGSWPGTDCTASPSGAVSAAAPGRRTSATTSSGTSPPPSSMGNRHPYIHTAGGWLYLCVRPVRGQGSRRSNAGPARSGRRRQVDRTSPAVSIGPRYSVHVLRVPAVPEGPPHHPEHERRRPLRGQRPGRGLRHA